MSDSETSYANNCDVLMTALVYVAIFDTTCDSISCTYHNNSIGSYYTLSMETVPDDDEVRRSYWEVQSRVVEESINRIVKLYEKRVINGANFDHKMRTDCMYDICTAIIYRLMGAIEGKVIIGSIKGVRDRDSFA